MASLLKAGLTADELVKVEALTRGKKKDKAIAYLLLIFLGGAGAHKFYQGKIGMGIAYLFTFGFLGIGLLIDLFTLSGDIDKHNNSLETEAIMLLQMQRKQ